MKKVMVFAIVLLLAIGNVAFAEHELVGRWEGIGSVYSGMNMEPMGEWVEFKEDMTGTLFMLKEFPFTYTVEGDSVHIIQEYGLTFDGKLVGDELILDNGIEYHFARNGAIPAATEHTTTAVAQDSFTYEAIYFRFDNEPFELNAENIVFSPDGTGEFDDGNEIIPFAWSRESDAVITLVDQYGDSFRGTAVNDLLIGVYDVELTSGSHKYTYVFQNTTESGASMAPLFPAAAEIPTQGSAYNAVSCVTDGTYMECTSDGLQLNADGTGTVDFSGGSYAIQWEQDGADFTFVDESGDSFEGLAVGDVIQGVYTITFSSGDTVAYEYIFNAAIAN